MMQGRKARSRWLTQTLVLQSNTPTQDDNGQPIESWSDVFAIRCEIIPKGAREFTRSLNSDSEITSIIRTRYLENKITPLSRLRTQDSSRIFNVVGAFDPDGSRTMLEIHAVEDSA